MTCTPKPYEPFLLWQKAHEESATVEERSKRYRELMIEHGLLIKKTDSDNDRSKET